MASEAGLRAGEPGDLEACLDLLREMEWAEYGRCPFCKNLHPGEANRFHGRFRHEPSCKLARLIHSELLGDVFLCDCYVPGSSCTGSPLFGGKPHDEAPA